MRAGERIARPVAVFGGFVKARAPLAAVLAAALALGAIDTASATTKNPVSDKDDSAGAVDLSSVRLTHDSSANRLVFTFKTYQGFGPSALRNRDGAPGSICVNIWTDRAPGEDPANYEACITARPDKDYRGTINSVSASGSFKRVGSVEVEQRTTKRLVGRVCFTCIGSPRKFRWTAQATTFGKGCSSDRGCLDVVPAPPDAVETELR